MRRSTLAAWIVAVAIAVSSAAVRSDDYEFVGGYPTATTVHQAYYDADLSRAIEAYKFFYPTVSIVGTWKENDEIVFTPNSDTPYAGGLLDLSHGPMVIEIPPGPVMAVINDLNQRVVMDLGLSGPDAGKGGKHVVLPPGWKGKVPAGHHTGTATTNRVLLMLRAIPTNGDDDAAVALLETVKIRPLESTAGWKDVTWIDMGARTDDFSPVRWERSLDFWTLLHEVIDTEPAYEPYRMNYGQLASLGIEKGKPFAPDERMAIILEKAARMANDQMRVQAFADRRPDRVVWTDRRWEQAQFEPASMFLRTAAAGSLYWLGTRDGTGAYLDGAKSYKLSVPLPVPAKLFWSVTVYDPTNRSEIATDQGRAALRSLFELKSASGSAVDLYFGPTAPAGHEAVWIKTIPGRGWFTYFRIYGPEAAAFDGTWKPGDFELVP